MPQPFGAGSSSGEEQERSLEQQHRHMITEDTILKNTRQPDQLSEQMQVRSDEEEGEVIRLRLSESTQYELDLEDLKRQARELDRSPTEGRRASERVGRTEMEMLSVQGEGKRRSSVGILGGLGGLEDGEITVKNFLAEDELNRVFTVQARSTGHFEESEVRKEHSRSAASELERGRS